MDLKSQIISFLKEIPLGSRIFASICIIVFILDCIFHDIDFIHSTCLIPSKVVPQFFRLYSYTLVHANFLHLFFNLLVFLSTGPLTEKAMGTFQFFNLLYVLATISSFIFIVVSYIGKLISGNQEFVQECVVGSSGLIFAFITRNCMQRSQDQMALFGSFNLKSIYYPWALLFLTQIIIPNASFVGHLSGILCGLLYWKGFFTVLNLPDKWVMFLENLRILEFATKRSSFVASNALSLPVYREASFLETGNSPVSRQPQNKFTQFVNTIQGVPNPAPSSTSPTRLPGEGRRVDGSSTTGPASSSSSRVSPSTAGAYPVEREIIFTQDDDFNEGDLIKEAQSLLRKK